MRIALTYAAQIKDGAYVTNLTDYNLIETYWVSLYLNDDKVIYLIVLEKF